MFQQHKLNTERLILRWMTPEDAEDILTVYSDKDAMQYWSTAPINTLEQATAIIERADRGHQDGSALQYAIVLREEDRVIGTCSLFNYHHDSKRAELGYILHSSLWGQGLMKEALIAFINHAFDTLNLRRIEADIDPRNHSSRRILQKLAFVKEGELRERWQINGNITDSEIYGLIKIDWPF